MITTITLNASIDKADYMDGCIENGRVMRVGSVKNTAGGKGLNVARVIKLCGENVLASGLAGGFNGAYLEKLLDEDDISHAFVHIEGETRSCINILDEVFGSTEYLEPGCAASREEEERFLQIFPKIIEKSTVVTMSGSVPQGVSKDIYKRMIQIAKDAGKQVILDTSGELLKMGLEGCPTVVKPNRDEMEQLFHTKIQGIGDVLENAEKIRLAGIPYVVVSLGGDGALMFCEEGAFQAEAPKVRVLNTVGCGDSMVGALAVALHRRYGPKEALRYAVAVASANAASLDTGNFDPAVERELSAQIHVRKI